MDIIIYKWAAFALPRGLIALCALQGGHLKLGRSLVRRWECLSIGSLGEQVEHACAMAARLNEGKLRVHDNATLTPEKLISKVRTICHGAVAFTDEYPGEYKARINAFLFEIEEDRKAQWKHEFEAQAKVFALLRPVQRCRHNKTVFQKEFPATESGFAAWQGLRIGAAPYVRATALIQGGGEV